jgi:hypothetical protein
MGELGCIPIVQKRLEQCMHLGYNRDYLVITDTPQITTPCKYRYNWSAGSSFCTVTFNTRRRNYQRAKKYVPRNNTDVTQQTKLPSPADKTKYHITAIEPSSPKNLKQHG